MTLLRHIALWVCGILATSTLGLAQQADASHTPKPSIADERFQVGGFFEGVTPQQEDLSARTAISKKFVDANGQIQLFIGGPNGDVHYQDAQGQWQDIDLSIQENADPIYPYANTQNRFSSYFAKIPTYGVQMNRDGYSLTFGMQPILHSGNWSLDDPHVSAVADGQTVVYEWSPDVRLAYELQTQSIFHTMTFDRPEVFEGIPLDEAFVWAEEIIRLPANAVLMDEFGSISYKRMVEGEVRIMDGNEALYHILPPRIWDSQWTGMPFELREPHKQPATDDLLTLDMEITPLGAGHYRLTTLIPVRWLRDPARQYPVVLDPTYTLPGSSPQLSGYGYPWMTDYMQKVSQMVFHSSDIGASGTITSVGFYQSSNNGVFNENLTVKMKHTSSYDFTSSAFSTSGWSTAYSGSQDYSFGGNSVWRTINLSNPFSYNGSSNLMVETRFQNSIYNIAGGWYYVQSSYNGHRWGACDCSSSYPSGPAYGNNIPVMRITMSSSAPQTGDALVYLYPSAAVSAGAQWRLGGSSWVNSGTTLTGIPTGTYTVDFRSVSGYTTPSPQTVTISANQTTTTTATYTTSTTPTGNLYVSLSPSAAISAGAQWRLDYGAWRSSGTTLTGVTTGSHTIDFSSASGYNTPSPQTVTINANQTTSAAATYTTASTGSGGTGSVAVSILPSAAVSAGAQWRVDGGSWRNSGTTVSGLSVGGHTIEFSAATGYDTPPSQSITVYGGQTSYANVNYTTATQAGSVTAVLSPAGANSAGAQWRLDYGAWQSSSTTLTNIPTGSHYVDFSPISGYTTPAGQTIQVSPNQNTYVSGYYSTVAQTGNVSVTLYPSAAAGAGAQWRIDGGSWQNSGATVTGITVGTHTISFNSITGYSSPASQSITVYANQTSSTTATYTLNSTTSLGIAGLTLRANSITGTGNTRLASGNVRIERNGCSSVLQFSSDITVDISNPLEPILTGNGNTSIYLTSIPNRGQVTIYHGNFSLAVNGTRISEHNGSLSNSAQQLVLSYLGVEFSALSIECDGIIVEGLLSLPQALKTRIGNYVKVAVTQLGISQSNGIDINGGLTVRNIKLKFLTVNELDLQYDSFQDDFTGTLDFETPAISVILSVGVSSGELDYVQGNIGFGTPIPIGTTGIGFKNGYAQVNNISSSSPPLSIGIGSQLVPMIPGASEVIEMDANIQVSSSYLIGNTSVTVFDYPASNGRVELRSGLLSLEFDTDLVLLRGHIEGRFASSPSFRFTSAGFLTFDEPTTWPQNMPWSLKSGLRSAFDLGLPPFTVGAYLHANFTNKNFLSGYVDLRHLCALGVCLPIVYMQLGQDNGQFDWSIGTNFYSLPVEARQGLVFPNQRSQLSSYTFALTTSTPMILIEADKPGVVPDFEVITPTGDTLTAANVGTYPNISYLSDATDGKAAFTINTPVLGDYIVNLIDADSVIVYNANSRPSLAIQNVVHDPTNRLFTIDWEDADPDDDALIEYGLDTDLSGADGHILGSNISENSLTDQVSLAYNDIPTGTYYLYGIIQDELGQFSIHYNETPFTLIEDNAPPAPLNLFSISNNNGITLAWTAPAPYLEYEVHYSDETGGVNEHSPVIGAGGETSIVITDLPPGRYYEFMVTALDSTYSRGLGSNVVSEFWASSVQNNNPAILPQTFPDVVTAQQFLGYQLLVMDADNDPLTYTLVESPPGMTVSPSGYISWTPADSLGGLYLISLSVDDGMGGVDSTSFQVEVVNSDFAQAGVIFDKALYVEYDDHMVITVRDRDFSGSPDSRDNILLQVYSTTDPNGVTVLGQETEPNSREFQAMVTLSNLVSNASQLRVSHGDQVFARYFDGSVAAFMEGQSYFTEFIADFGFVDSVSAAAPVTFTNWSTGSGMQYFWDFGDGGTSNDRHPEHQYTVGQTTAYTAFTVSLTITDEYGHVSTHTETIHIGPDDACGRDIFEPNEDLASAKELPMIGVQQNAQICPAGDLDYFQFSLSSRTNVRIQLTGASIDYNLHLYNAGNSNIGTSLNQGDTLEIITMNFLNPGIYYVRVTGKNDATDGANGYNLKAFTRNVPFTLGGIREGDKDLSNGLDKESSFHTYPNPASTQLKLAYTLAEAGDMHIVIRAASGQIVWNERYSIQDPQGVLDIPLEALASGMYILELQHSTGIFRKNFAKE